MNKKILPVAAVAVIVIMAMFLPRLLYYYSDRSYLNQVKYSDKESVNIEMTSSTAKTKKIDEKLTDLDSIIVDEGDSKKKVEVLFDPSEDELKTIRKNIKDEVNYWLEVFNCKEITIDGKKVKLTPKNIIIQKCYSIVGENASFPYLEATATLSKNPQLKATIYLDNTTNKIYDIKITGNSVQEILIYAKKIAESKKLTFVNIDTFQDYFMQKLADYYGGIYLLSNEASTNYEAYVVNGKGQMSLNVKNKDNDYVWQCDMIGSIVWRVEAGEKYIDVGINGFDNDFY